MTLTGDNGVEFELALIEQHLDEFDDDDAAGGYPILSFRVGTEDDAWEETAPSINLYELHMLADWLTAVGEGEPNVEEVDLLEINLNFDVAEETGADVMLRIGFHLEDRPGWSIVDAPTDEAGAVLLHIERKRLLEAAAALTDDLHAIVAHE